MPNLILWHWPQYTLAGLYLLNLLLGANKHNKPRTGLYSFWEAAIGTALSVVVLYFGGFWTP